MVSKVDIIDLEENIQEAFKQSLTLIGNDDLITTERTVVSLAWDLRAQKEESSHRQESKSDKYYPLENPSHAYHYFLWKELS